MDIGIIARRYATALADCAAQRGEEEQAYNEACALLDAMQGNPSTRQAIASPIMRGSDKIKVIKQLSATPFCSALDDFFNLVVRHHREPYLDFMLASFKQICKKRRNISEAVLSTAAPASQALVQRMAAFASKKAKGEVQIRTEVRPELVGGFVFRLDDMMIDASISTQIALIERAFTRTTTRI